MSFNYARVFRDPTPSKTYGYEKVSSSELRSIVMRVQRPTVNTDQNSQFPDGYFKHPIRPTSGFCKRVQGENVTSRPAGLRKRGMSPKAMNRVVRRLQATTISRMAANGQITSDYDAQTSSGSRPRTSEENQKFLRRITRPTSSSQRRDLDAYWDERENSEYNDVDFSDDVSITRDEMVSIVDRVRTPTVASERGERCPRRKQSVHVNRDKLPLVSGLARSKKVDDIVDRLHRPTTGSTSKKTSTTSTELYV